MDSPLASGQTTRLTQPARAALSRAQPATSDYTPRGVATTSGASCDSCVVACPSCGSQEFREIAPTWVECTATWQRPVLVGMRPVFGPGRFPPLIGRVPIYDSETVWCRVRHHCVVRATSDSGPWPSCECGTFAIGMCQVCGDAVCGDDSTRRDRRRVCLACNANADHEAQQQQHRAEEERRRADEEHRRPAEERRAAKLQEMAEEIARHGRCRAYPEHPKSYTDAAGNCTACVIGVR